MVSWLFIALALLVTPDAVAFCSLFSSSKVFSWPNHPARQQQTWGESILYQKAWLQYKTSNDQHDEQLLVVEANLEKSIEQARMKTLNALHKARLVKEAEDEKKKADATIWSDSPVKVHQKPKKPTWKGVIDPKTGRTYYYHLKTRETTWTKPEELLAL